MITKKQLTNINKFKSETVLPVLQNILLEPGIATVAGGYGGRSKFIRQVFYIIRHELPIKEKCLISIEEFVQIARKFTISEIKVKFDKVLITTDVGTFTLHNEFTEGVDEELPKPPELSKNTGYEITKKTIDTYKGYISRDDLRPAMMGIYFGDGICATNGHRLRYDFESGIGKEEGFILSPDAISLVTKGSYEHCKYGDSFYGLVGENETIIYKETDEIYPNYRAVIPKEFTQTSTFDSKEISKIVQGALIASNYRTNKITLTPEGEQIKISSSDFDESKSYKSPSFGNVVNSEGGTFKVGFNGNYFLDMIRKNQGEIVIKQLGPNKPAIINERELLMPVMLDSYPN